VDAASWSGCCKRTALTRKASISVRSRRQLARAAGVSGVHHGDFRVTLATHPSHYAAVTATDLLEHLTKPEVLQTFDDVGAALAAGGVFIGRVPKAVSPLGGHIRNGNFTHHTSLNARSIRQLAAAAGFDSVLTRASPPVVHGLASAARVTVWQVVSACYRIALAAEMACCGAISSLRT